MSKRIQRVNELIKRELSQILLKEVEFPRDILVTITRVETLSNLRESKIFVSVMFTPHRTCSGAGPDKNENQIIDFLNRKIYWLQQKINKRLKMRPIPKIIFLKEEKTEEAAKIEEILEKLKKEEK